MDEKDLFDQIEKMHAQKMSFRKIASSFGPLINYGDIYRILIEHTYPMGNEKREALSLDPLVIVPGKHCKRPECTNLFPKRENQDYCSSYCAKRHWYDLHRLPTPRVVSEMERQFSMHTPAPHPTLSTSYSKTVEGPKEEYE